MLSLSLEHASSSDAERVVGEGWFAYDGWVFRRVLPFSSLSFEFKWNENKDSFLALLPGLGDGAIFVSFSGKVNVALLKMFVVPLLIFGAASCPEVK